jgi:hypothetical protein
MLVPDEFAFDLNHHHIRIVQLSNGARGPVIRELRQLLGEIDLVFRKAP